MNLRIRIQEIKSVCILLKAALITRQTYNRQDDKEFYKTQIGNNIRTLTTRSHEEDIPETIKERIGAIFNRLPANNPNLTEQQRTDIDYWPTDQSLLILHIEELIEQVDRKSVV